MNSHIHEGSRMFESVCILISVLFIRCNGPLSVVRPIAASASCCEYGVSCSAFTLYHESTNLHHHDSHPEEPVLRHIRMSLPFLVILATTVGDQTIFSFEPLAALHAVEPTETW